MRKTFGITLIELIAFIVISAIVLPAIFFPFYNLLKSSFSPERYTRCALLAQLKMEYLTKDPFYSIPITSVTYTEVPGFPENSWAYDVAYIKEDLSETSYTEDPPNGFYDYKRIWVSVKDKKGEEVELATIRSKRPQDE